MQAAAEKAKKDREREEQAAAEKAKKDQEREEKEKEAKEKAQKAEEQKSLWNNRGKPVRLSQFHYPSLFHKHCCIVSQVIPSAYLTSLQAVDVVYSHIIGMALALWEM